MILLEKKLEKEKIVVLKLKESIFIDNISFFQKDVLEVLSAEIFFVVLDISDIDYIISQAFGTIVKWAKKNRDNGGELTILNKNPRLKKILEILKFDKIVSITDNLEEALKILN